MKSIFQATVRILVFVSILQVVSCYASTLRIGLVADPDGLDPAFARVWSTTIVLNSICEKLVELRPDYSYEPKLATEWSWSNDAKTLVLKLRPGVKFHDGEPFNAAAVKYTIERNRNLRGSTWVAAFAPITNVDVIDDLTVKLTFSMPMPGPLFGRFVIAAGMIVSPKAAEAAGDKFGLKPVCAGPYRFVERVPGNHITLERFADYWDNSRIHIDRVTYRIIPDSTVRLANLQGGALDLIEQMPPADALHIERDRRFKSALAMSLGHMRIYINVGRGERAKTPLGLDPRVRKAFSLSIDREALNNALFEGQYVPAATFIPPGNRFEIKAIPVVRRDVARAKALLAEAGVPSPKIELVVQNAPVNLQVAEVIQAMSSEAGFDTRLLTLELGSAIAKADRGDHEAMLLGWPGFADPDQNVFNLLGCKGTLNYSGYCNGEMDKVLEQARAITNVDERVRLYTSVAETIDRDAPYLFLYHQKAIWLHSAKLNGFVAHPDGITRVMDLKLD